MKAENKLFGNIGESLATNFLKKNGYKIVERNYQNKIGEIDIIARKGDFLVFVEVKSRSSNRFGLPREAIDFHKQQKIKNTAQSYLKSKYLIDKVSVRFDCIELIGDKLDYQINHIENIF